MEEALKEMAIYRIEKKNMEKGLIYRFKLFFTPAPKNKSLSENADGYGTGEIPRKKKINQNFLVRELKDDFLSNPIVFWLLILSLLANVTNWAVLLVFIKPVDKTIILHYNVYFGVDLMGDWRQALLLPLIGLILYIINLLLGMYFYAQKERIATHILLMAVLMAQLSLLVASASVIIINY